MTGSHDLPPQSIPTLDELTTELDVVDADLMMAYARYLEKPSPSRMEAIGTSADDLYAIFGDLMRKILQDRSDVLVESELITILATLLHKVSTDHTYLLADYSSRVTPASLEEAHSAYEAMVENLSDEAEESLVAMVDEALSVLRELLGSDMDVIEGYVLEKGPTGLEKAAEIAKSVAIKAGKTAVVAAAGVILIDRFAKNRQN